MLTAPRSPAETASTPQAVGWFPQDFGEQYVQSSSLPTWNQTDDNRSCLENGESIRFSVRPAFVTVLPATCSLRSVLMLRFRQPSRRKDLEPSRNNP